MNTSFIPLDKTEILQLSQFAGDVHLFPEIDSTNRYLKTLSSTEPVICCAERQTQGRGRFGRQWNSPFGENIYFSYRQTITGGLDQLSGLGLVVSLALYRCLETQINCRDIRIKWPNDLLWQGKKFAGILIESFTDTRTHVIIGIGLNVNTDTNKTPLTDTPHTSLYSMTGRFFDRNVLIACLIKTLFEYFSIFTNRGFDYFQKEWQETDYLFQQSVTIRLGQNILRGQACGVNQLGQLIVKDKEGINHLISSGEASLMKNL